VLVPSVSRRTIGTLEVISLFKYSSIEPFLLTKHSPIGHRIYQYLGTQYMVPFLEQFACNVSEPFTLIGIDEHVRNGYAHTSLLTRSIQHRNVQVQHAVLLAQNRVNYAGKTLQYRLDHPRDFLYTGLRSLDAVLIDDIITTGITLQEAQNQLHQKKVNVLFALTLADAQN
jgi:competence protein ComFC